MRERVPVQGPQGAQALQTVARPGAVSAGAPRVGISKGEQLARSLAQIAPEIKNQLNEAQAEYEQKEAERKRNEAEGIRDFQEIVSSGISEELLRWKGIEATAQLAESQNSKVVVIGPGEDGLPLILGGN